MAGAICLVIAALSIPSAFAAPVIDVIVGSKAAKLERFAADQMAAQLGKLAGAEVRVGQQPSGEASHVVLIGHPNSNPRIADALGKDWPKVSAQGLVLKSYQQGEQQGIVVGGGSPAATLWAVYELGHRLGVRSLLRGDIYPDTPIELKLSGFDETIEPTIQTRGWTTIGSLAYGPASWSVDQQRQLLVQLAKLKFNHLVLEIYPRQPFIDISSIGVGKQQAQLFTTGDLTIDREMPGRVAFGTAKVFENADFAGKTGYEALAAAGKDHVQRLIAAAHDLGMTVEIAIRSDADSAKIHDLERFQRLIYTKIGAAIRAYPDIDALQLEIPLPEAKDAVRRRLLPHLLENIKLPTKENGQPIRLVISGLAANDPLMTAAKLPAKVELVLSGGRTTWRAVEQLGRLKAVPAEKTSCRLAIHLTDEQVGVMPQSAIEGIGKLIDTARTGHWRGFQVRGNVLGESDPAVYYLSRTALDAKVTPRAAHDDLFTTITGKPAAAERLWQGFVNLEAAAKLIDQHQSKWFTPHEDLFVQLYQPKPLPDWWKPLVDHYTQNTVELYRSRGGGHPRARPFLFHYAKRGEYSNYYLAAVEAIRKAALAKHAGKLDEAVEAIETAVESMHDALDTLSDVALDPSDRGLIVVLATYAYRPLLAEYEKLLEATEQ